MVLPTLFKTPFRAWFFSGSLAAALLLLPWLVQLYTALPFAPTMGWFWWHQHEMVYAIAVPFLLGFLLTASANWTGASPVTPVQTLLMFCIWWLARLLQFMPVPSLLLMVVDMLPLLTGAVLLSVVLIQHKNYRNLVMSALLLALFGAGTLQYLQPMQVTVWARFSVLVVILFIVVFGGRVIPFFTAKRIGQTKTEALPWLERSLIGSQVVATLVIPFAEKTIILQLLALVVALLHMVRWARWQRVALWKIPLLWSLHLAYAGIALGWLLIAAYGFSSIALHALTIGGMGMMLIAFSGRVSLAHAGHPLQPPKAFIVALVLLILALVLRAWLPLSGIVNSELQYLSSGLLWSLAFLLFTLVYIPIWFKPRADGQAE